MMLDLSFLSLISIVILNCIGSGLVVLPPRLSELGINCFYAWVGTGLGAFGIGMIFVILAEYYKKSKPNSEISIHDLVSAPFSSAVGTFIRHANFWGYWLFAVTGNALLSLTILSAIEHFFPDLVQNYSMLFHIMIFGIFYLINRFGIGMSRFVSLILCIVKIVIMIILPLAVFLFIDLPIPIKSEGYSLSQVIKGMFITLWPFVGIESIIMEQQIDYKMLRPAMIWGILICLLTYILNTYVMMTKLPDLATSSSCYADLFSIILGPQSTVFAYLAIIMIVIGSLHGWTMTVSSTCASGGEIVPKYFRKTNEYGVYDRALLASSILPVSIIFIIKFILKNDNVFNVILDAATILCLLVYGSAISAFGLIMVKNLHFMNIVYFTTALTYLGLAFIGSPLYLTLISIAVFIALGFSGYMRISREP